MKEKITKWYNQGLWSKDQVKDAVNKGILSPEDYLEITGEEYNII